METTRPLKDKRNKHPNKHQERTDTTLRELLDAAETIFVRDGFERAQVEAIAAQTGRSRGAVYAHFKSKEDLFLALLERRIRTRMRELHDFLDLAKTKKERTRIARDRYACVVHSPEWALLVLEFKLFALRNPDSRNRLRKLMEMLSEEQNKLLYGETGASGRQKAELAAILALLRGIPSALVLESKFDPALADADRSGMLLTKIFDAVMPPE